MGESSSKAREISLGENFDVVVAVNGARLEIRSDGDIDVYTNAAVHLHPAVKEDSKPAVKARPKPGDRMPDGSVYAGISPDTTKPIYATRADAPLTYTFDAAQKYASNLEAHGHHDWRVPTGGELNMLYHNRAAIGGFDACGSDPAGWYWSSQRLDNNNALGQSFSDGTQNDGSKSLNSSLRCIR